MQKKICFVLTSPFVLNAFLLKHLASLADEYCVMVCLNAKEVKVSSHLDPRVEIKHFPISRRTSLLADLYVLCCLIACFSIRRFDAVHTVTPKGGLLGMMAAKLCRIPVRTHIFTGQVWATRRGFSRELLRNLDRLLAYCATDLLADSLSQARFLEAERVARPGAIKVFGSGSISGVDLKQFAHNPDRRACIRAELGIHDGVPLLLFLGRLQREKGVLVLAKAFSGLGEGIQRPHLLFVGPDEECLTESILALAPERCLFVGLTSRPEEYLDAADLLILPSFREGFGSVIIEAAAMGRPAVASCIYGLTDAVLDGETGILCSPRDDAALKRAIETALEPDRLCKLGANAKKRAHSEFSAEVVTSYWLEFYHNRLKVK
jgi:glycosyltransferase involved in cell wall biosynthesis